MKDKGRRPCLSSVVTGGVAGVACGWGAVGGDGAAQGLAKQLSARCRVWRPPLAVHDSGKIVLDLALTVALGGDAACDIGPLRAQPGLFGLVASDATVSRPVASLAQDVEAALAAIAGARAVARERVWGWTGAPTQDGLVVIDLDAALITAHSEKE